MNNNPSLPVPDPAALKHSLKLRQALLESIAAEGPLSFGDYMQFVLYGPGYGYYMAGNQKIGADGDFVTAPLISPLFGHCMAEQLHEVLAVTAGSVLEIGAGTGELAAAILDALQARAALPERYCILEPSAELAMRQQALLKERLAVEVFARLHWCDELPTGFVGVVLANEVIDAMPVEVFVSGGSAESSVGQLFVSAEQDSLALQVQPAAPVIANEVRALQDSLPYPLPAGYRSEINLLLKPWIRALAQTLLRGLVILVDYGYPQNEYYAPERMQGSLRCYYRHHLHDDVLLYPGLMDITADVNFTQLARVATEAGFDLHGYTSQAQFLLANGLLEYAAAAGTGSQIERYQLSRQINTLSGSSAMGERFKVMGLSKELDAQLRGFTRADLSHRL